MPPEGSQRTRKRSDGVIETTVSGRVLPNVVRDWTQDFKSLGGSKTWLFLAEETKGYDPAAIEAAAEGFKAGQRYGLETIVAVITSRMVRMGASLVAMISRMDIQIVENRREAEARIFRKSERPPT